MMGSIGHEHNPKFGISSIPSLGFPLRQTASMEMEPRQILAKNVRALMQAHPRLSTIVRLSDASGVSKGVVERMTKAESNTGVDHLMGIAKAFGIPVWSLLAKDLNPLTGETSAPWPFEGLSPQQFEKLPERKKGMIEARAIDIYHEWETQENKDAA